MALLNVFRNMRYFLHTLAAYVCAIVSIQCSEAYAYSERELKVEAAYIYNFFNYITFPQYSSPEGKSEGTICLYDRKDLQPYLEYVRDKKKLERALSIRNIQSDDLHGCDLLYVSELTQSSSLLRSAIEQRILTVGMNNNFLDDGGMIQLQHQQERIAMFINKSLLEKYGYAVSSRLLALAKEVRS